MVNSTLINAQNPLSGSPATNIVFIDTTVENFSSLLAGLKPNTQAVILDPTQDGVSQITNFLSQHSGAIDSVQIVSHGSAGSIQLGSTSLSAANLDKYQSALSKWFTPSPGSGKTPDLLIYGCDVAAGNLGTQFIKQLSTITGADVAASTDLTGNAAKGGNWILEKATGVIEAGQAFTKKIRNAYQDVLATYTVTNTNDSGAGSLRQAITDANATLGVADTINFNIAPGGTQTIYVGSATGGLPLPYVNDTVTIDGTTQPGYADTNTPIIVLDGSNVTNAANYDGLRFVNATTMTVSTPYGAPIYSGDASGSLVQGLVINNFPGSGIKVSHADQYTTALPVNNITIQNNYIGTDITGTVAKSNGIWGAPENTQSLYVNGSSNTILRNNLVSGNFTSGIVLRGVNTNAIVDSNIIGTDVSGRFALGNQRWGFVSFDGGNDPNLNTIYLTNNLISANGFQDAESTGAPGVDLRNAGTATGNIIGTDINKSYALQNRGEAFNNWSDYSVGYNNLTVSNNFIQGSTHDRLTWGYNGPAANPGGTTYTYPAAVTPTLAPAGTLLSPISANSTSNNGTLVKDIVGSSIGNYAPVPTPGIAITQADNTTNGTWQYSTDNGATWSGIPNYPGTNNLTFEPIPTGNPNPWSSSGYPVDSNNIPTPAEATPALLLAADDKNRIRFIPNAGFTGTTTGGLTYKAWDQRFGGNGTLLNISTNRRPNNIAVITDNLSTNSVTAQINVLPINTAPTLDPLPLMPASSFITAAKATAGVLVSNILTTSVIDPDAGAQKGIAITELDSTNGVWQYSINGQHWISINANNPLLPNQISETSALLLDSNSKLRFVPNTGYTGTPSFATVRAWDGTNGSNANPINTTTNGGSTSVSSLDVNLLNTAPVLAPGSVPASSNQTTTDGIPDGILVTTLAASAITDVDVADLKGIAITDAPNVDGTWQYSLDNGTSWANIGAVSPTNALLLDINNKIRFVSSSNVVLAQTISFRAWDQTTKTPGSFANVSLNGGPSSFSTQLATTTINVLPSSTISSPTISADVLALLRNPPAPATPAAVIVGTPDTSTVPVGATASNDEDCPCEAIINQQKPNPVTNTIQGTNDDDLLVSTATANTIYGFQGDDTIYGTASNDNLFGGAGKDTLRGGYGNEFIRGGKGTDIVYGGRGKDVIKGGGGGDIIYGRRGADLLAGGKGSDEIYGGYGQDFVSGGRGNDRLFGGVGKDTICGCGGDDVIRGGKGKDTLNGVKGNDILIGGKGNDILTGGAGSDRFRIQYGKGTDTITDFTVGEDFLELARGLKYSDLQITQGVGATVIGLQPGTLFPSDKPLALLTGVTASSLTANSFTVV